tara:strand:+ start:467 stop:958 length:492 start_codon:yes stop_codon:yes gene_type:complete
MKKITFLTLISLLTLNSIAQNKFGHIDSQELMQLMPEVKAAEEALSKHIQSLGEQEAALTGEYQQKVQEFTANEAAYDDLIKQDKYAEIKSLEQRIQVFREDAQQSVQKKQLDLMEPINKKAIQAIEDVATEGGYTYIFDKAAVLYAKESENILSLVKKKLGL